MRNSKNGSGGTNEVEDSKPIVVESASVPRFVNEAVGSHVHYSSPNKSVPATENNHQREDQLHDKRNRNVRGRKSKTVSEGQMDSRHTTIDTGIKVQEECSPKKEIDDELILKPYGDDRDGIKDVNTRSGTKANMKSSSCSLACHAALNVVGSIGSAVEHCIGELMKNATSETSQKGSDDIYGNTTFDTYEVQLLHDIQRMNRMNSWETNGTFTTVGTMNTDAATDINSTLSSFEISPRNAEGDSRDLSKQDDKVSKSRKQIHQKKKNRAKRTVNFEYPPISSMKECPRLTEEERKNLFFSAEELDVYEYDRKHILCDDVEVIAVEFTDSDQSVGEEDRCDTESKRSDTNVPKRIEGIPTKSYKSSCLRAGKYSRTGSDSQIKMNDGAHKIQSPNNMTVKREKDESIKSIQRRKSERAGGKGGKMKGVQIFLRQRSLG